jgi:hypothetical protein
MTEAAYQSRMRATATAHGLWLFRFNVGGAWAGQNAGRTASGDLILRHARWVDFGPPTGFPDTAGWLRHEITTRDVGRVLPVFAGVEFKSATGRVRAEQQNFLRVLNEVGGLAAVARPPMTWNEILEEWR